MSTIRISWVTQPPIRTAAASHPARVFREVSAVCTVVSVLSMSTHDSIAHSLIADYTAWGSLLKKSIPGFHTNVHQLAAGPAVFRRVIQL
jgi:hypothetical protein